MVRRKFVKLDDACCIGNGVSVRTSSIPDAGNGLFADRAFARGEVVTFMDGHTLSDRDVRDREPHELTHVRTLMTHFLVIDGLKEPFPGAGGGSFANDSLCPKRNNVRFEKWTCDDLSRFNTVIVLRATRDIAAGEEIFVSYGSTYWRRHAADAASAPPQRENGPEAQRDSTQPPALSSAAARKPRAAGMLGHFQMLKRRRPQPCPKADALPGVKGDAGVETRARARRRCK